MLSLIFTFCQSGRMYVLCSESSVVEFLAVTIFKHYRCTEYKVSDMILKIL